MQGMCRTLLSAAICRATTVARVMQEVGKGPSVKREVGEWVGIALIAVWIVAGVIGVALLV